MLSYLIILIILKIELRLASEDKRYKGSGSPDNDDQLIDINKYLKSLEISSNNNEDIPHQNLHHNTPVIGTQIPNHFTSRPIVMENDENNYVVRLQLQPKIDLRQFLIQTLASMRNNGENGLDNSHYHNFHITQTILNNFIKYFKNMTFEYNMDFSHFNQQTLQICRVDYRNFILSLKRLFHDKAAQIAYNFMELHFHEYNIANNRDELFAESVEIFKDCVNILDRQRYLLLNSDEYMSLLPDQRNSQLTSDLISQAYTLCPRIKNIFDETRLSAVINFDDTIKLKTNEFIEYWYLTCTQTIPMENCKNFKAYILDHLEEVQSSRYAQNHHIWILRFSAFISIFETRLQSLSLKESVKYLQNNDFMKVFINPETESLERYI